MICLYRFRSCSRYTFLLLVLLAFIAIFICSKKLMFSCPNSAAQARSKVICDFSALALSSKSCILDFIKLYPPAFGHALDHAVKLCTKIFASRLSIAHLHNLDDIKEAAKPLHDRQNCTVITIGIGDDIEAEKQLKFRIPSCKFYGADPAEKPGVVYRQIGRFLQAAISDRDGYVDTKVNIGKNRYVDQNVKSVSLLTFLNQINVSIIDYVFMDAEGAEYKLIPYMVDQHEFRNGSIIICQISLEVHGNLEGYGMDNDKFDQLIQNLLQNGTLLPIWSRYGRHMHLFLIDTSNRYCVDKYFDAVCSDDVEDEWRIPQRKKYAHNNNAKL